MNPLEAAVTDYFSSDDEGLMNALIGELWGITTPRPSAFSDLLDLYLAQLKLLRSGGIRITSHRDAITVIEFVRHRINKSYNDLRADLLRDGPEWIRTSRRAAGFCVDFALRVGFLIATEQIPHRNTPVSGCISNLFRHSPQSGEQGEVAFQLNTQSLHAIGFKIVITPFLSKHLVLEGKTLQVFPHVDFLNCQRTDTAPSSVYPQNFLQETFTTVRLLKVGIGSQHTGNKIVYCASDNVELGFGASVTRELKDYPYWQTHLKNLNHAFKAAKTTSLKEWWRDPRDVPSLVNVRLAVIAIGLALFFGLIQSITGIISAVAAYNGQSRQTK